MKQRKMIKLGGSIFEQLDSRYFKEWKDWCDAGHELIILHGGGPALSAYCETLEIESVFREGVRVTTEEVLLGAERVLGGEVQSKIVYQLNRSDLPAVGLTGIDGASIGGEQRQGLGAVGDIRFVDKTLFETLLAAGYIPVVTSLITGPSGALNSNGDTCAIAVANALDVDAFELLTDVEGVRLDGAYQAVVTREMLEGGIKTNEIHGGMIPKVEAVIEASKQGIPDVRIRSGKYVTSQGTRVKEETDERITTNLSTS